MCLGGYSTIFTEPEANNYQISKINNHDNTTIEVRLIPSDILPTVDSKPKANVKYISIYLSTYVYMYIYIYIYIYIYRVKWIDLI